MGKCRQRRNSGSSTVVYILRFAKKPLTADQIFEMGKKQFPYTQEHEIRSGIGEAMNKGLIKINNDGKYQDISDGLNYAGVTIIRVEKYKYRKG